MALEQNIERLINHINEDGGNLKENVYLSIGKPNVKAVTKLMRSPRRIKNDIVKQCEQFRKKTGQFPTWIKVDVVTKTEPILFDDLKAELEETRRNYIEYGVAFDDEWNLSFLPEVINANAFVKPIDGNKRELSEQNINNYLYKYTSQKRGFYNDTYKGREVLKFFTKSYFLDGDEIIDLEDSGYRKGLRKVSDLGGEIDRLIDSGAHFLENEIQPDGRYIYGMFPHFDKPIGFYNVLRHASSTYALTEGLEYLGEDVKPVEKPIDYLIKHYMFEKDGAAYIFDDTNNMNEIKLGQNAAFIFAVVEYLKQYPDNKVYLHAAEQVAEGILRMIDPTSGDTTHVLSYPSLDVKEKFRIIYYDGEAALALLRLYQVNQDKKLLERVKVLFERFIANDYWKYHDHWLGYCTNELVQIDPDPRYFELGIKNVSNYLDYMKQRETTFPTFLEMLMATYHLVEKAKKMGHQDMVENLLDEEKFLDVIHSRADYQRTGFFYPEIAMYFKNPARILGSFFIKHHGYRVRIDDIEHYVSGYVQYQKIFNNK